MRVNGEAVTLAVAPNRTLLEVLREDLRLTGTKHGCELGECGACAVLVDGQPVLSCLTLAVDCEESDIITVEGLSEDSRLHPLQEAFADSGAAQCGYCTPGFLVTARALLDENPHPTRPEIAEALSGNLCRCTGYVAIFDAVEAAAQTRCGRHETRASQSLCHPERERGTCAGGRHETRASHSLCHPERERGTCAGGRHETRASQSPRSLDDARDDTEGPSS